MPKYKNRFSSPDYIEEKILNENGETLGTIRVKPTSVLWKPKSSSKYYSVSLDKFIGWITNTNTKAQKTSS